MLLSSMYCSHAAPHVSLCAQRSLAQSRRHRHVFDAWPSSPAERSNTLRLHCQVCPCAQVCSCDRADAPRKVSQSGQGSQSPKLVTLQAALDRSVQSVQSKQEVIWLLLSAGPEVRRGVSEMCAYLEGFAGDAATEMAASLDQLSVSSTSAAGNGTQQPSEHSDPVIEQALGVSSSSHTGALPCHTSCLCQPVHAECNRDQAFNGHVQGSNAAFSADRFHLALTCDRLLQKPSAWYTSRRWAHAGGVSCAGPTGKTPSILAGHP